MKLYSVTFTCDIDFEVNADNVPEAYGEAISLLKCWIAENAEASDFTFVKSEVIED